MVHFIAFCKKKDSGQICTAHQFSASSPNPRYPRKSSCDRLSANAKPGWASTSAPRRSNSFNKERNGGMEAFGSMASLFTVNCMDNTRSYLSAWTFTLFIIFAKQHAGHEIPSSGRCHEIAARIRSTCVKLVYAHNNLIESLSCVLFVGL